MQIPAEIVHLRQTIELFGVLAQQYDVVDQIDQRYVLELLLDELERLLHPRVHPAAGENGVPLLERVRGLSGRGLGLRLLLRPLPERPPHGDPFQRSEQRGDHRLQAPAQPARERVAVQQQAPLQPEQPAAGEPVGVVQAGVSLTQIVLARRPALLAPAHGGQVGVAHGIALPEP